MTAGREPCPSVRSRGSDMIGVSRWDDRVVVAQVCGCRDGWGCDVAMARWMMPSLPWPHWLEIERGSIRWVLLILFHFCFIIEYSIFTYDIYRMLF